MIGLMSEVDEMTDHETVTLHLELTKKLNSIGERLGLLEDKVKVLEAGSK